MERKPLLVLVCAAALAAPPAFAAVTCANENTTVAETTPTSDFTDNGDGTVTHIRTGLVWMRCSLGQNWNGGTCAGTVSTYTWRQALQVAEDVNSGASDADGDGQPGYAGQAGWRLPNIREMESIVERRCWSPAINGAPFPATQSGQFWSSSTLDGSSGNAWFVSFESSTVGVDVKNGTHQVRLVRAGQ